MTPIIVHVPSLAAGFFVGWLFTTIVFAGFLAWHASGPKGPTLT